MKILVIPDIHGKFEDAFIVINEHKDHVDKVVVLGDYVDGYESGLDNNYLVSSFYMLCEMARQEPDKFCLCLGNHDMNYISSNHGTYYCPRYHSDMAFQYRTMFAENLDILNVAYLLDGCLFSHAGVSMDFYKDMVGKFIRSYYLKKSTIEEKSGHENAQLRLNLKSFDVETLNFIMHYDFDSDGNGISWFNQIPVDDKAGRTASCVWIRPDELFEAKNWPPRIKCQVIGHTPIGLGAFKSGSRRLIAVDSRDNGRKGALLDTCLLDKIPWKAVTCRERKRPCGTDEWLAAFLK